MSRWTHVSCLACFHVKYPDKTPHRLDPAHRESEVCCYCSAKTVSGIYVRDDPNTLKCKGEHKEE